eukprot:PhF_6_TR24775/c1_g1_i1/m.34024
MMTYNNTPDRHHHDFMPSFPHHLPHQQHLHLPPHVTPTPNMQVPPPFMYPQVPPQQHFHQQQHFTPQPSHHNHSNSQFSPSPMMNPHHHPHHLGGLGNTQHTPSSSSMSMSPQPPHSLLPRPVPLEALRGRVVDLSREDTGCRMLLRILESPSASDVASMHDEVVSSNSVSALMAGRHSNYLMQRLFEVGTPEQVTAMLTQLVGDVASMARSQKGTYAIRKVVDSITTVAQAKLMIDGLMLDPVAAVTDAVASQVLRRMLRKVHANEWGTSVLTPLIKYVSQNMCFVGKNQSGCCVVQRLLDAVDNHAKAQLICYILQVCNELVADPYGNYVVQYVLDLNKEYICVQLAAQFLRDLRRLASNKYSSNVVEKCLATSPPDVRDIMILEMCVGDTAAYLLQDEYGNYVVQTALRLATPQQNDVLRDAIAPYLSSVSLEHVRKKVEGKLTSVAQQQQPVITKVSSAVASQSTGDDANIVAEVPLSALPEHMTQYRGIEG